MDNERVSSRETMDANLIYVSWDTRGRNPRIYTPREMGGSVLQVRTEFENELKQIRKRGVSEWRRAPKSPSVLKRTEGLCVSPVEYRRLRNRTKA